MYSFHMPLFMFLSGCVAKYGVSRSITGNLTRLVLPFLAWYLIAYLVQWATTGQLPDFAHHMMALHENPDMGLWFLWVLFLCHVFFYVMFQAQKVGKCLQL
nr:acyltransferase family protein [Chitinophaga tropicalis]